MARRLLRGVRACILRNPGILGGKPIIAGTRISVEFVLELLASGMTPQGIAQAYDLSIPMVRAAVRYAASDLKRADVVPRTATSASYATGRRREHRTGSH